MGRKLEFNKDRALHRAMKLFWSKGYDATSMQDLVDVMEINRFSIYNTLGDKKTVYLKALEHYRHTVLAALLSPLVKDIESTSAKMRLDAYVSLLGKQLDSASGHLGCMIQNTSLTSSVKEPDVRQSMSDLFSDIENTITDTVREGISSGDISVSQDAESLAWFVLSHLQGLIILRRSVDEKGLKKITGQIEMLRETIASW